MSRGLIRHSAPPRALLSQNCSTQETEAAVPVDLLRCHDAGLACKWICRFVIETRKTDGSAFPPATLRSLVSGLNREIQRNKAPFSVLDKNDARFRDLQKTLDSLSSKLHRQGLGATRNSAKVIDPVHEELFWKKSLFGYSSPKILQRTVFSVWVLILFYVVSRSSIVLANKFPKFLSYITFEIFNLFSTSIPPVTQILQFRHWLTPWTYLSSPCLRKRLFVPSDLSQMILPGGQMD